MFDFATWIAGTSLSQFISQTLWIVPWLQIVHISAIAAVVSAIFMIDLRILNVSSTSVSMVQTARRFVPWIWGGLVVLAVSGSLLIVGEPARSLLNQYFWIKMGLLAFGILVTLLFQSSLRRRVEAWESGGPEVVPMKVLAIGSFVVWCGIILAGRWIAYA